jgi:hypothetical protein
MSKKDYEQIAAILKDALTKREERPIIASVKRHVILGIVKEFSRPELERNPKFDHEKFMEACGFVALLR